MTIRITIECDAAGCSNSKEITNYTDADVLHAGYHPDPRSDDYHYCGGCWRTVIAELESEERESEQQDGGE